MTSVRNAVPSQSPQPLGVGGPVRSAGGWDAPIVVEVYALGCGVLLAGQRHNLPLREGAFELEANGKIFVFDPLRAGHAKGFVPPVESDIAAIGQQIEAVNQKDLPKFGGGVGHDGAPLKTVILSMPQGSGKTLLAPALAEALGCTCIVDEWACDMPLTEGALHLTNDVIHEIWQGGAA